MTTDPVLASLTVADDPEPWAELGFAVEGSGCRLGSVDLVMVGPGAGRGIVGWSLDGIPSSTTVIDGVATSAAPSPTGREVGTVAHPNGVTSIDHVVLLSPDLDRTRRQLEDVGIAQRRARDVDESQSGFAAQQRFFRAGEVVLEVIGATEATAGDERPAKFYGLALTMSSEAELDVLAERLGDRLGRVKDAVQPGRRIATLRHRDVGLSVAIAFMSPGAPAV